MAIPKIYSYFVQFCQGTADLFSPGDEQNIEQAVAKAASLPEYIVEILMFEHAEFPLERDFTASRLDSLKERFAAESISMDRLSEDVRHEDYEGPTSAEMATRAEICVFPRSPSLSGGDDPPYLSTSEVVALSAIALSAFSGDAQACVNKIATFSDIDLRRITGFDSCEKWIDAGAPHPWNERYPKRNILGYGFHRFLRRLGRPLGFLAGD